MSAPSNWDTVTQYNSSLADSLEPESDSGSDFAANESAARPAHPHLPIEVCERIIDFISIPYPIVGVPHSTLAACCLTCRAWFPRSRLRLYQDVHVEDSNTHRHRISRFIRCLKHNPDNFNGRLVQQLQVSFQYYDPTLADSDPVVDRDPGTPGSGISHVTNQLPALLPNLSSFIIEGANLIHIHTTCYASLSRFTSVHYLKLQDLTYSTHDQLFRFIAGFRNLASLEVTTLNNVDPLPQGRTGTRRLAIPRLQLTVSSSDAFLPDMMNWFSPHAEFLDVSILPDGSGEEVLEKETQAISEFIQRCGDSLQHLRFKFHPTVDGYHSIGHLDLSCNTALRSLELVHIPIGHDNDQNRAVEDATSLAHILSTVASTCLEDVTVLLHHFGLQDSFGTINSSAWKHIDSAFSLPIFDRLRRIHVGIHWQPYQLDRCVSGEQMARLLPRLASRPAFTSVSSDLALSDF